jgi:hypothetical protein
LNILSEAPITRYDSPIELPSPPKIFLELVLLKFRDGVSVWTGALRSGKKFDLIAAEDRDTEVRLATRSSVRAWDLQLSQAIVEEN